MPRFSVISIAKTEKELEHLRRSLANQTFRDFEFIVSTGGTIPEAWNNAISKATGDFIVLIESDAVPLSNKWLEEISRVAEKGVVYKGLEINPTDLDLCNLVCDSSILKAERFDVSFHICEDTELFARLRSKGVRIEQINDFPVIHAPSHTWEKTLSRSLIKGVYWAKIFYLHGRENVDDVNTRNFQRNRINPVSERVRIITENALLLFGEFLGLFCCLPILIRRRMNRKKDPAEML
jgi:glycosyltransferase involved in cell wall biosynthesis